MKEKFDSYSFHEIIDRTHLVSEMFETYVSEHSAVQQIPQLRERAGLIAEALADYYQLAGAVSMEVEERADNKDVISAEELDAIFDSGNKEVLKSFNHDSVLQPDNSLQEVNVSLPVWVLKELDFRAGLEKTSREEMLLTILQAKVRDR